MSKSVDVLTDKCLDRSIKPMQSHQKRFIKAFMRSTRRGTIAIHSPGSGKTLMAMGAAKCYLAEYPESHVIMIAPASLIGAHEKQLHDYEKKLPGGKVPQMAKFSFYTYTGFSNAIKAGELKMCSGALVICDEAQALKGAETRIFQDLHTCAGLCTKVILLSATPITNTDADLMNLMAVASGGPIVDTRTMDAILGNDQLMRAFFGCQLSWYTSDPKKMAAFFPKKEVRVVPIVMNPATLKTYITLENDKTSREIEGIFSLSGESVDTDLQSFFNGLRRISSSSVQKIDFMIDFIKHIIMRRTSSALGITKHVIDAHTDKFVIFTHFKDHGSVKIISALEKAGIQFGIIDGSTPKASRSKIEADYVAGRISVILISAAGSTGLNLFETGFIFLVEPSWNQSEVQQVEARGIRYLGHAKLPKSKQNIMILKLMLIKPSESRNFEKIIADRVTKYESNKESPSIDIKMYVDSLRKQNAIDARLSMLEKKVPSLEDCANSGSSRGSFANIARFDEMRVYHRTSSKIASTPSGIRSSGSYYSPGRQMSVGEIRRVSFNDGLIREIISGSGILRISSNTAILLVGSHEILAEEIINANSHIYPHIMDEHIGLTKKYRIGIVNWAFNFSTGAPVRVAERQRKNILKQMNEYCDLLIVVAHEDDRSDIKDVLVGRSFNEASYKSEFDRILNGSHSGIVVIAC